MLKTTFLLLSLPSLLAASPCPQQGAARAKPQAPPGMVFVEGGMTKIGSTKEHVESLGLENVNRAVSELLQFEMRVDDFFLQATEVTNEQYLAFVQATGYMPPEHWAEEAIEVARAQFVRERRGTFVPSTWWRMNWEGKPWKMPESIAALPVVYVDYRDAQAYARWAGWRLPTEFEFQRAGRGKTGNAYPWGDKWEDGRAASERLRIDKPQPVGSFPAGSVGGIHDLVGNVWEWTASPFQAYEKFDEKITLEIGKGKNAKKMTTAGLVSWDSGQRVVVGGSYQMSPLGLRLTTRRNTDRDQSTGSLGFRCASSLTPGADLAAGVLRDDLPPDIRPANSTFDPTRALALDRWRSRPGTAKAPVVQKTEAEKEKEKEEKEKAAKDKDKEKEKEKGPPLLPGYAVVEGYDYVLYVPTKDLEGSTVKNLVDMSLEQGPVPLGMLSLSVPAVEPALPPGTYVVSFRGAGASKGALPPAAGKAGIAAQDPVAPPTAPQARLPEGYDIAQAGILIHRPDGEPMGFLPASDFEMGRPVQPTAVKIKASRAERGKNEQGEPIMIQVPMDQLNLKLNSAVRISNKGYTYTLQLRFAEGTFGEGWRL